MLVNINDSLNQLYKIMEELKMHPEIKKKIKAMEEREQSVLKTGWAVGGCEVGLGRVNYAIIVEGENKPLLKSDEFYYTKELYQHIVDLHNASLEK